MRTLPFLSSLVLITSSASLLASDWPQYLGPNRDAKSPETSLLQKWPEGGPKQMWQTDIGIGFGGPAIRDGKVFLYDREDQEADILRAFDLKSGKELWRYRYEAPGKPPGGRRGSRSTPTVTENYVYSVGWRGDVVCLSRSTHEPVWRVNLEKKYGRVLPTGDLKWGYAYSPLVHENKVIVPVPAKDAPGLVAFHRKTGDVVWESEAFGGDHYVSPILRTVAGKRGIVQMERHQSDDTYVNSVLFIDPASGETIWRYDGFTKCNWPIPAPTVLPDRQRIFVTGGYGAGSDMFRVEKTDGGYRTKELFELERGAQIHPAIWHEGYLYANINENSTLGSEKNMAKAGLACIDPEKGKILWRTGVSPNFNRGAVIFADGRLIVLHGSTGELYLVEPSPKKFKPISRFTALDQKGKQNNRVWAPMALSNGRLVVRDQYEMKAFDLRAGQYARAGADE